MVNAIESITFRVYCTANVKEIRITDDAGYSWISRVVPSATEAWIDVTLTKDGDNISKSEGMDCFADTNGYFKPVNFGFRFTDNESTTVYIDSITFNMKEADTVAPVITYNGENAISTTEGEHTLTITATDSTGNKTEKTVKVVVVASLDQLD